jgi:ketosteroid isomerase-like protein
MGQNITTTAQDNINVIRKFWEALNHPGPASLQTMTKLMDENIEWDVVPLNMKRRGRDEMRQLIEGAWAHWAEGGRNEITNVFASEEWVCLEWTARHAIPKESGTMTKEIKHLNIEITPKGQKIEIRAVSVFRMKDGKIISAREYSDYATIMRQLGVVATAGVPE